MKGAVQPPEQRNGKEERLALLMEAYANEVLRLCYFQLRDRMQAEAVRENPPVQEPEAFQEDDADDLENLEEDLEDEDEDEDEEEIELEDMEEPETNDAKE